VLVAGAGAVVIAGGTTAAVLTLRGGDPPAAAAGAAPALAHDPVPKPLNVDAAPANCGVPAATARAVAGVTAPVGSTDHVCTWSRSGQGHTRNLDVDMIVVGAVDVDGEAPASAAMGDFGGGAEVMPGAHTPVTGLADEAYTAYHQGVQRVLFRAGNVVTNVEFGGVEVGPAKVRRLTPNTLRAGAFTVATAIARTLGASAVTPRMAAPPSPPPITRRSAACAVVPRAVVDRFVPNLVPGTGGSVLHDFDSTIRHPAVTGCGWSSRTRKLEVRIESAAGKSATHAVAREYVRRHYNGREHGRFQALRGPGDQAFSRYTSDDASVDHTETELGQVVFRVRNVLVTVWYGNDPLSPSSDAKMTVKDARNGAYAVAAQVARTVHA
jgi:hypothetical protein